MQKKIVLNYLSNNTYAEHTYFSIDNFDYSILSGEIQMDLYLIKSQDIQNDTLLSCSELDIKVNLLDILFSQKFKINNVNINSPLLKIIDFDKPIAGDFNNMFSILSSFNNKILLSTLNLNNIHVIFDNQNIDSLDIRLNNIIINNDLLNFSIDIIRDSSFFTADYAMKNQIINLSINKAHLHHNSPLYDLFNFDQQFTYQDLDLSGSLYADKNLIRGSSNIKYANSLFDIDIISKSDTLLLALNNASLIYDDFDFLPIQYHNLDIIDINGELKFFKKDSLDTYSGFVNSNYGNIKFKLDDFENKLDLNFIELDLGALFQNKIFGKTNAKCQLNHYSSLEQSDINIDIQNILFNNYNYQNIIIQKQSNQDSVFLVNINDKNISLLGQIDIASMVNNGLTTLSTAFSGMINKIHLNNLHYSLNDSLSFVSTEFCVDHFNLINFESIDAVNSLNFFSNTPLNIKFNNFTYQKGDSIVLVDSLSLDLHDNKLYFTSSFGSIYALLSREQTSYMNFFTREKYSHNFLSRLEVDLNNASVISDIFLNDIKLYDSLVINFKSDSSSGVIFSTSCASINIAGIQFSGINILTDNNNYKLSYSLLNSDLNKCQIEGKYQSYKDYIEFDINNESFIYFSDQSWNLNPKSRFFLRSDGLEFQKFGINLEKQTIILNGFLDKTSELSFSFHNFNIEHIKPFVSNYSISFDGILDGVITFNKSSFPLLSGDFEIDNFSLNSVELGKLKLENTVNQNNDSLYISGVIQNKSDIMNFMAKYPFNGTKNIIADINFNNFPAEVLDLFITPVSNLSGNGNGNIRLFGPIDNYSVSGITKINNINFKIPYLGNNFLNKEDSLVLNFSDNLISINDFKFYDQKYNTTAILSANILHTSLKNMSYDLSIKSDSLYALNTNQYDNQPYYGDLFLSGEMLMNGSPSKTAIEINGSSQNGTKIMIPLYGSKEIKENKFIQFVNDNQKFTKSELLFEKPKLNMDFNLKIDNQSEIQLIFDKEVGDLIKGYGQGDLLLKINKDGDFEIFGDFEIEKGNYLFTLQDVITKSFEIERGGYIKFNGDLDNAIINLNLLYEVQASLNPLNSDYDRNKKSLIICKMYMFGDLLNPEILFSIDIPNSDQIIETSLETLTNTDQKLLEQFLYLLIANSFLIENDPTIDYLGNTLTTTGTELLSNQLSNWLSQTTDLFDLGFKWIPGTGDSLSYQQVELAISKKFLDDRIIINGNVGTPPEQSEANIVGDVDIEYNVFQDGRLKLRVFRRSEDYDPLSESIGYEEGIGIFFKNQFNSFKELLKIEKRE